MGRVLLLMLCFILSCSTQNNVGVSDNNNNNNNNNENTIPDIPKGISITAKDSELTITFTASKGATYYNLYWDTTKVVSKESSKVKLRETSYTHKKLNNGTYYYYAISAGNDDGESKLSDEVKAKPVDKVTIQRVRRVVPKESGFRGFGISSDIHKEYALVNMVRDSNVSSTCVFKYEDASWKQQSTLVVDDTVHDYLGLSLAISDKYAVVTREGRADEYATYIFNREGEQWVQSQRLKVDDEEDQRRLGQSVGISGEYLIASVAKYHMAYSAAYIFKREGESWKQQAKLTVKEQEEGDDFAQTVAIDGKYAVVGLYKGSGKYKPGAVFVFKRSGNTWREIQKITAPQPINLDYFGARVDISGDYIIITAATSRGKVYIFKREGEKWEHQTTFIEGTGHPWDSFGHSVSITPDYAVVGAPEEDWDRGAVYFFKRVGTKWKLHTKLSNANGEAKEYMGFSVSIYNNTFIYGVPGENTDKGAVYVYNIKKK